MSAKLLVWFFGAVKMQIISTNMFDHFVGQMLKSHLEAQIES